jgi:hypothetical protein
MTYIRNGCAVKRNRPCILPFRSSLAQRRVLALSAVINNNNNNNNITYGCVGKAVAKSDY